MDTSRTAKHILKRMPIWHLLILSIAGCATEGLVNAAAERIAVAPASGDFVDSLTDAREVTLEQSAEHPIVRLSGFDRRDDGTFMIGDVSEGLVTLFTPEGRVRARIGRKGQGPGEFDQPRYPRFGNDGRIYIADGGLRRLQLFDSTGAFLTSIDLSEVGLITDFDLLSDGRLLFAIIPTAHDSVLVLTDSSAKPIRRFLPIGNTLPEGSPDNSAWMSVRQPVMTVRHDSAFVVSTISDTLWSVDLNSGAVARTHLAIPGYTRPALPEKFEPGPRGLSAWANSFHAAVAIYSTDRMLYIPFVQGVLNYGDPTLLVEGGPGSQWRVFHTRRPLVDASGTTLTTIADPQAAAVGLRVYSEAR